ncbi:MAG TPA: hypothetical protein VJN66_06695 [Rhodanobacteraceae bacterium]|nr:hypothetical protein [Rhodanobacteraceae bacterium]
MFDAAHIGEAQIDEFDIFGLEGFEDFVGGHGELGSGGGWLESASGVPVFLVFQINDLLMPIESFAPNKLNNCTIKAL